MSGSGFYGKLASRGDFVQRGLPPSFVQAWDSWLATGLLASQQQLGEQWLEAYLVSPLWRFALAPGVCGPDAMVGVLMPSIDRVGRYFPLTVAQALAPDQALASVVCGPDAWFERSEALLLDTLAPQASFEAFDAAVRSLALDVPAAAPVVAVAGLQRLAATEPATRALALAECACAGASLWWGRGSERIAAGLMRCTGLPPSEAFGRFLLGKEAVR